MLVTIYYLKHPDTEEIRYIGRTKNNLKARLRGHLATAKKNKIKTKKDNWFLKLYKDGKRPLVESICEIEGWEKSYIKEQELILSHIKEGYNLLNLYDRGPGHLRNVTEKQKKKISEAVKQRHREGVYDSRGITVTIYDLLGNKIKTCKKVREVAEYIGVGMKHVETNLKRGDKRLHTFQLRRGCKDKIEPYPYFWRNRIKTPTINSVNCLGSPEEGNQQPSLSGDTLEGSTTSSESHVDNNSTTKAGHSTYYLNSNEYKNYLLDPNRTLGFLNPSKFGKIEVV